MFTYPLLENDGVADVVVKAMDIGSTKEIVAYVTVEGGVDLATGPHGSSDYDALRVTLLSELRRRLPPYMVPAFLEVLPEMPILPSGKTDRKKLGPPVSMRLSSICTSTVSIPPETPVENEIAGIWSAVFGSQMISVMDNFFTDLGGHSMSAAIVVSKFRKGAHTMLQQLGIADVYAHPTIRDLARHVQPMDIEDGLPEMKDDSFGLTKDMSSDEPVFHSNTRVWLCGCVQFFVSYVLAFAFSFPFVILLRNGFHPIIVISILVNASFPHLLIQPIIVKWVLIGRFRPGRYPLWGWYYFRLWLATHLMAVSPLMTLASTPFMAPYLRLFGYRIGRGCHIGSGAISIPDLIDIGDNVSIGYGAVITAYVVRGGWLYLAPIKIKNGAFIGNGAVLLPGSEIGENSAIREQTLVAEGQVIPDNETWQGSPAERVSPDPSLKEMESHGAPSTWSRSLMVRYALVIYLFFMTLFPAMVLALNVLLWWWCLSGDSALVVRMAVFSSLSGIIFVISACTVIALSKHVVMHRTKCGISHLRSAWGMRKWMADVLMGASLALTNSMYATLYASPWLRALGAKIGPRSEGEFTVVGLSSCFASALPLLFNSSTCVTVSTISSIDPDLMDFGEECFLADMASMGAAFHHRGCILTDKTKIGTRTFIGNAALVNPQTDLKDNMLIGVLSVPPENDAPSGSNWLGSPAIFLPRRQESKKYREAVTYKPPLHLVILRLTIEFFRTVMPVTIVATAMMAFFFLILWLVDLEWLSVTMLSLVLPGIALLVAFMMYLVIVALKWIVIGRYHKHVAPLWSHFVWRSEFITALYESAAVPGLLGAFRGTPFFVPLLRLLGAQIGARVYLETTYVTEFDLVHIEDDVAVGSNCSLQTHLFEDRVMKMDVVSVGK